MNRTTVPGDNVSDNGPSKPAARKDKIAEARAEESARRLRSLQSGFRAIVSEMKRVTWPSREEWVSATMVTIILVVIVALWTTVIGQVAEWIFKTGQ